MFEIVDVSLWMRNSWDFRERFFKFWDDTYEEAMESWTITTCSTNNGSIGGTENWKDESY
jgi:hypothetical protein